MVPETFWSGWTCPKSIPWTLQSCAAESCVADWARLGASRNGNIRRRRPRINKKVVAEVPPVVPVGMEG